MHPKGLYKYLCIEKTIFDQSKVPNKYFVNTIVTTKALIFLFLIGFSSFALSDSLEDQESRLYMNALTQEAFRKTEPKIIRLQVGESLDSTGIEWNFYQLKKWSKQRNVAVADGWVSGLSGRLYGAIYELGKFTGISTEFLYGEHVFGYVLGDVNLVPCYLVKTKAKRITEPEYEELDDEQRRSAGVFSARIDDVKTKLYFHDVRVIEVKELDSVRSTIPLTHTDNTIESLESNEISEHIKSFVTRQKYESATKKLRQISIGTHAWDIVKALGGKYSTHNFGRRYVLKMDGYLKPHLNRTDYIWSKYSTNGKYGIWPFGYLENNKPKPRLALIFKNNILHSIVEDATKEQVEKKLSEIGINY